MVLFVVEGEVLDVRLIEAMCRVYPVTKDHKICVCKADIPSLYKGVVFEDKRIVNYLQERYKAEPHHEIHQIREHDISETYLFFDYDPQNRRFGREDLYEKIDELLRHFDDETRNGKLFVSYPMVEALMHTSDVSKSDKIAIDCCGSYKSTVTRDCSNILSKLAPKDKSGGKVDSEEWHKIVKHNIHKAHELCKGDYSFPKKREDVAQKEILTHQGNKHINPKAEMLILSAFPFFLYDYFGKDRLESIICSEQVN